MLAGRAATPHLAVTIGADHHAAPAAIGRVRDLLAALEPEADVRVSRLDEFFRAAAADADGAPALHGELRWSYGYTWTLQGVHATRAPLKRRHAEAELLLERMAEPLAALALAAGRGDRRPLLRDAWRALVRSQFHDSIGGCTSDSVARRVAGRLDDAVQAAREIARASLDALTGNDPDGARDHPEDTASRLVLWNPVARERGGGVVVADLTWFRRDVLVGPPGDASRDAATVPAGRARRAPRAASRSSRWAGPRARAPGRRRGTTRPGRSRRHPRRLPRPGARRAWVRACWSRWSGARAPQEPGVRAGAAQPRQRPAGADRGPRRHRHPGRPPHRSAVSRAARSRVLRRHWRHLHLRAARRAIASAGCAGPVAVRVLARGPLVATLEVRGTLAVRVRPGGRARLLLTLHAHSPALRCTLRTRQPRHRPPAPPARSDRRARPCPRWPADRSGR